LTRTTIAARAQHSIGTGVSTQHPPQDQVEDLPRKEKAVGWEETDLRDTSTTEPGITGANVVSVGILSHV
jgi:hypothetical protein